MSDHIEPMDDPEKLNDALFFACALLLHDPKKARGLARDLYRDANKILKQAQAEQPKSKVVALRK